MSKTFVVRLLMGVINDMSALLLRIPKYLLLVSRVTDVPSDVLRDVTQSLEINGGILPPNKTHLFRYIP
jgi:hypothetical protein